MNLPPDMFTPGIDQRLVSELFPEVSSKKKESERLVDETTRNLPWMQQNWIRQTYAGTLEKYNKTFGDFTQKYYQTRDDAERRDWHYSAVLHLIGFGPDRKPYGKEKHWNPLLEKIWLPWARQACFLQHKDIGLAASKYGIKLTEKLRDMSIDNYSYAIPTTLVLEYMVHRAPGGKIIDAGAGSGYWAKLLSDCGGNVIAIDNQVTKTRYYSIQHRDAIRYMEKNGGEGHALFLCWPRQDDKVYNPFAEKDSLATSVLEHYRGDTVFFIGEFHLDMGGTTFDFKRWITEHDDWEVEREIPLPTWPTIHDVFICATRI